MTEVHFTGSTIMNVKKDMFLSNKKNKQSFLCLLSRKLEQMGCQVSHARGDADMLIVQTAIQSSSRSSTVLVGDDTDLLILLCFHTLPMKYFSGLNPNQGHTSCHGAEI